MERKFEEMMASAGDIGETLRLQFEAEHARNMAALRRVWDEAKPNSSVVADLSALYHVSHDIKGQGGTFDQPLLTDIAGLLCKLLWCVDKRVLTAKAIEAIECHVAALELVTRRNITGRGGPSSAKMIDGLKTIAAAVGQPSD